MNTYLVINSNVFVWGDKQKYLVYNCDNGYFAVGDTSHDVESIICELNDLNNLYRVIIPNDWKVSTISNFVSSILNTKSGRLIDCQESELLPVTLRPVLKVQNDISYVNKVNDINSVVESVQYVTIHLGGETNLQNQRKMAHTQVTFPMPSQKSIDLRALKSMISYIPAGENLTIRLLEYTDEHKDFVIWLIDNGYKVNVIHLAHENRLKHVIGAAESLYALGVCSEATYFFKDLSQKAIKCLFDHNIRQRIIIDEPEQLEELENIQCISEDTMIYPFLDADGSKALIPLMSIKKTYFKDTALSKNDIFIRSTLNTNYFGQIEILASGDIVDAIGFNIIGNIQNFKPNALIRLFHPDSAWFQTRAHTPCKDCIYHHICIPPSRYEKALGQYGLCENNNFKFTL